MARTGGRLALVLLLAVAVAPTGARAAEVPVPNGQVTIAPTVLEAAHPGQQIRFTLSLDRVEPGATLLVELPSAWVQRGQSGLRPTQPADLTTGSRSGADVQAAGRRVELHPDEARRAAFEITDVGVAAGTYALQLTWRAADGSERPAGSVDVYFNAPHREAAAGIGAIFGELRPVRIDQNVSNDTEEEQETYVVSSPASRDRVLVASNDQAGMSAWVSNNAGGTWTRLPMPGQLRPPGGGPAEAGTACCDPMAAADASGNLWFGGLACANNVCPGKPARIVVARVPGPTATSYANTASTAGLPINGSDADVDKPMMTIDNDPASPRRGRLYVVWNSITPGPGSAIRIVMSQCDTVPTVANCDNPASWSTPVVVSGATNGSLIYGSVAAAPDGSVYVTWWDYSAAGNAIRGAKCGAAPTDCTQASNWSAPATVAMLDGSNAPVPFACPIVAQPGGRAGPAPAITIDHSSAATRGRVYVAWGDLRAGSGSTRCAASSGPDPSVVATPPSTSHLRWDVFVGSAQNALPGGALPSAAAGTRLVTDGEGGADSDDWFAAVAVDQSNGQAYASFYSTHDDPGRATVRSYYRAVGAQGGAGASLGALSQLSAASSSYAGRQCCRFGNDYGDYLGLDASQGTVWPVWTDNSRGNGEVETFTPTPAFFAPRADAAEGPGADGDGRIEPGEPFTLTTTIANGGTVRASGVSASVASTSDGLSVTQGGASYGDLSPTAAAGGSAAYAGTVAPGMACGSQPTVFLNASGTRADNGQSAANTIGVSFTVQCDPPPPTPTTATTPVVDRKAPGLTIPRVRRLRLTRAGYLALRIGPPNEPVKGTAGFKNGKRLLGIARLSLKNGQRVTARIKLSRANIARLRRARHLTVTMTVTVRDAADNVTTKRMTFSILPALKR